MNYIGRETTVEISGSKYTLSRLTRAIHRDFAAWVHSHTPDPLAAAALHINSFSPDLQKLLLQQAWDDNKRRMDIEGPEVREAMQTIEGSTKLLQLLLAKHHPDLTEDDVYDLAQQHLHEEIGRRATKIRQDHPELTEEESVRLATEEVAETGSFRLDLSTMPRD